MTFKLRKWRRYSHWARGTCVQPRRKRALASFLKIFIFDVDHFKGFVEFVTRALAFGGVAKVEFQS